MTWKRFFLLSLMLILVTGAGLLLTLLYFYHHPSAVKALIAKTVSREFGVLITIGDLDYSLQPLRLQAAAIQVREGKRIRGFDLLIPELTAEFKLEGTFGRKTLVVRRLELGGVSLQTEGQREITWRDTVHRKGAPSSLSRRLIKRAAAVLFFRDIRFEEVAVSASEFNLQSVSRQILLRRIRAATAENGIQVDGSAEINWPASNTVFAVPHFNLLLDLKLSSDESLLSGRVRVPAAVYKNPQIAAAVSAADARLTLMIGSDRIQVEEGEVTCQTIELNGTRAVATVVKAPQITFEGNYSRSDDLLVLKKYRLTIPDTADIRGEAELNVSSPSSLKVTLADGQFSPENLFHLVAQVTGLKTIPLSVGGTVQIKGELAARQTERGWIDKGRLTVEFSQNQVEWTYEQLRTAGEFSGSVQANGRLAAPDISAKLSGRNILLSGGGWKIKPFTLDAAIDGKYPAFSISSLAARIPDVAFLVAGKTHTVKNVILRMKNGKINVDNRTLSTPKFLLSSDLLRNVGGSLTVDGRKIKLDVVGSGIGWAEAAKAFDLLPPGWRFDAADRFQATALIHPPEGTTLSALVELGKLTFADPTQSRVAENVSVRAEIKAVIDHREKTIELQSAVTSTQGEFLWNQFYLDLSKNNLMLSANTRADPDRQRVYISRAQLDIRHLLTVQTRGELSREGPQTVVNLKLQMPDTPLAPLFTNFIRDPLQYRQPSLARLHIDGQIAAEVHVIGQGKSWTVRGRSTWSAGNLETGEGRVQLKDIDLQLPLWYQTGGAGLSSSPQDGKLTIQKISVPFLPTQALMLPFHVRPNELETAAELSLRLPSGKIRIGPIRCADVLGPKPRIETRLTVEDARVDPFLKDIWPQSIEGTVHGELEAVRFDGKDVTSRGRLIGDIFGGKIILKNPGVAGVLGAAPNMHFDAEIQDLNLAQLTENTTFGKIQGIMRGAIENLELVNGQPQKFVLHLETVKKKHVPQRINIEAVENIARIGGGKSPFTGLARSFAAIFNEFGYDKIGIQASLENDVFKINGTVKKAGVEYLVKGGGIPSVDVVNLNPTNQISFKDMVKRIKRIGEPKKSPVVR